MSTQAPERIRCSVAVARVWPSTATTSDPSVSKLPYVRSFGVRQLEADISKLPPKLRPSEEDSNRTTNRQIGNDDHCDLLRCICRRSRRLLRRTHWRSQRRRVELAISSTAILGVACGLANLGRNKSVCQCEVGGPLATDWLGCILPNCYLLPRLTNDLLCSTVARGRMSAAAASRPAVKAS